MIRRLLLAIFAAAALSLLVALPAAAADATPSPPAATPTDTPGPILDESARDQISFGSNIHIVVGQTARDVICVGCSVLSEGTVERDLIVIGGNADIRTAVGRDAVVVGGNLHLGSKATVARDLVAMGGTSTEDPGSTVGRDRTAVGFPGFSGFPAGHSFGAPDIGSLFPGAFLVLLAALAMAIFPRQLAVTASLVEARPVASFGLGCVGILGGIALAILLAITVILIPVSLLISLGILLAWIFGWAAIYLVAGNRLLAAADQRVQPFLAVIVGGAVFAVLSLIPLVSIPLGLIGGSVALGAALGSRFGTRSEQGDFFAWGSRAPYFTPTTAMAPSPPPPPPAPALTPTPPQEPEEGNT
jgi:hypothetical protein